MDKKKIVTVLLSAGGLLVLLGLIFLLKDKIPFLTKSSGSIINPTGEAKKQEYQYTWVEWKDPAGFAFEYPKEVNLNNHPEDKVDYAFLELTKESLKGKILITCKDTKYNDLDSWLKNDELVKGLNSLDTKVASVSAKKVALGNSREITAFFDWEGVLYIIDSQSGGEDYWRQVYQQILTTFKMAPLEGESEKDFSNWLDGFDTSNADVVEPVEVVQ